MQGCANDTGKLIGKVAVLRMAFGCADTVPALSEWKRLGAMTTKGFDYRTFGAEVAEQYQAQYKPYDKYPVNVTTHLTGVVEFVSGAVITVIANAATTAPAMMPMRVHSCFFVSFFFLPPAETAPRLTC